MLGANPLVSNGSLMTAPDMRGRLRRLRERGGKLVVVDPRRTRTAEVADEHHFIRPGTDAHLLLGIVHTLVEEGLAEPGRAGRALQRARRGRGAGAGVLAGGRGARSAASRPDEIRRMARELAGAERAACYARIGTCTQEFGTLASWLVDVVNVLTGNLDREGGAMFTAGRRRAAQLVGRGRQGPGRPLRPLPQPRARAARDLRRAAGGLPGRGDRHPGRGPGPRADHGRRQPGRLDAQQRPARARDRVARLHALDRHLRERDDPPRRRDPARRPARSRSRTTTWRSTSSPCTTWPTTRPPCSSPRTACWTSGRCCCAWRASSPGQGPDADIEALDELVARTVIAREHPGADPEELLAAVGDRRGPERVLDLLLRAGPYDLTLDELERNPHGIDLGPHRPRLPEVLRTPSGQDRAGARADRGRPRPPARPRWPSAATATWCWSAAASCARTTPGCTTSTRS